MQPRMMEAVIIDVEQEIEATIIEQKSVVPEATATSKFRKYSRRTGVVGGVLFILLLAILGSSINQPSRMQATSQTLTPISPSFSNLENSIIAEDPLDAQPSHQPSRMQATSPSPSPTSPSFSKLKNAIITEDPLDVQAFIDTQVSNGEKHIVIPPGKHYVTPKHHNGKLHILLSGLQDVVIDGMDQAEIICTKTTRAITLFHCKNVTLRGLAIDYDPLPYTQGKIIAISDDNLTLTVSMISGYPKAATINANKNIEIFDSTTNELATISYYGVAVDMHDEFEETVIVTKQPHYASLSREKLGDIVVFYSGSNENQNPHAVFSRDSTDLTFDRITLYASNMFGFFEKDCSNSSYNNCSVDRRLPEDDIQQRGYRRLRSANADAFHSKHAAIGPTFKGLIARYNGDDGIAVNGHYHLISKISDGPTDVIRVIGKNGEVPNLVQGEYVELVKYSGERIPNAKILSFNPEFTMALEQAERDFLSQQMFSGSTQLTKFAERVYTVTLDRAIDVPMGSLIASSNRIGNGFRVEDCIVGPNRARGLLLKGGEGSVERNTIRDVWLSAIMIAPEYSWLEAGSGNNIFISNNTIARSHDVAIQVSAKGGDGSVAPAGAHNGIMVSDNKISESSMPAIAVTSTNGLFLFRNSITGPDNEIVPFWKRFEFGRQEDPERQIYMQNVGSVTRPGSPADSLIADSHSASP